MIELFLSVLDFALPILVMIFVGLVGTSVLVELGLMQKISKFVSPIFAYTNLPETCASTFVVAIGSAVASNSMLFQAKKENCINEKEVVLCSMMNATPAYFRELFTYQIPIVLPALGLVVGGFYSLVFVITAVFKILVIAVASKLFLKGNSCKAPETRNTEKVALKTALKRALKKEFKVFLKIAGIYLLATTVIFVLQDHGAFEIFSVLPLAELFEIPPETIVPLTSYVASPILGISLLGPMLHSGEITNVQAMIVLMLGSMFMLPVFAIRSQLPKKVAIFGTRLGVQIVVYSTTLSIIVRLVVLLLLLGIVS
ncbi:MULTISPECIES: nucleoside recognition domain-containing protein [unclassified Methanosarcina]|uniref:nucleoside recognition domain-containing protein n=1 Tax=unclassified Methanosarcina TaxID=2644672 RepID=UPI00061583F9|nr:MULTISPECIES: nucleoside recognition domain-containing protein [unclassified Methanosarcina]AKB19868.1 membrane protein, putative [Methanosarcina sp. WWM596]AKB22361.1 membrane protein, putative [Methanosarcina sp. WH1]